jgi:hypothetical protein
MSDERNISAEGLKMGLTLDQMKFVCPYLGECSLEFNFGDRKSLRLAYCHNSQNYYGCYQTESSRGERD